MSKYQEGIEAGMSDEEARLCHLPVNKFDEIFSSKPKESEVMKMPDQVEFFKDYREKVNG